jgi:hypothetical protein
MKMTSKRKRNRYFESSRWTARDFLTWYLKELKRDSHVSSDKVTDYLYGMDGNEKEIIVRIIDDITYELKRDVRRKIAEEQLTVGEQLANW